MRWPWLHRDCDEKSARAAQAAAAAALAQARSQSPRVMEAIRMAKQLVRQTDALAHDVVQTLRHL
jgi:hypothetical protein